MRIVLAISKYGSMVRSGAVFASHARYRTGEARRGQERPGEARRGQERPGEARRDQERPGETRRGQDRPGETRRGLLGKLPQEVPRRSFRSISHPCSESGPRRSPESSFGAFPGPVRKVVPRGLQKVILEHFRPLLGKSPQEVPRRSFRSISRHCSESGDPRRSPESLFGACRWRSQEKPGEARGGQERPGEASQAGPEA